MNSLSQEYILIVDDTTLLRRMVCVAIQSLGHPLLEASSGEEALALFSQHREEICVVLTDVIMPGMNGMELMDMIHHLRPELPVILMTAYSNTETLIAAIKKKAFDLILKPIDQTMLLQSTEKALKHLQLLNLEKNYLNTLERSIEEKTLELHIKMSELEESRQTQICEHEELKKLFTKVTLIKQEWEKTLDCIGDMVILIDNQERIRRCNRTFRDFCGKTYQEILGKSWKEYFSSTLNDDVIELFSGAELFHPESQRWFEFNFYPFIESSTNVKFGNVITIIDTTERKNTMAELTQAYQDLKSTQAQVLHTEKMASIGQLAAGVAHEINNPIGFVTSNVHTLGKYHGRLANYINEVTKLLNGKISTELQSQVEALGSSLKIEHILKDGENLIRETLDGTERVRKIVMDLKTFSRSDQSDFENADLTTCLESAINIVWNELKYKVKLERHFEKIPLVKCYPQQLNQVFVNMLVNASHAIEESGEIWVTIRQLGDSIIISFKDTGNGISDEHLSHIFEPFFTTKEVGKGTGLGLSISYDIIKKHQGNITVESVVGKGTTFTITLPISHPDHATMTAQESP